MSSSTPSHSAVTRTSAMTAAFDLADATAVLRNTPGALRALLHDLPPAWTEANEGGDSWSVYDVIGHLIQGERTDWIGRASLILATDGDKTFTPFDRTAMFRDSVGKSLPALLDEFAVRRAENLATVDGRALTDADLAREGTHLVFGTVTLRQLLATWVAHDLTHVAQIARVMAKQYREAVGPWTQFLSVMRDER